MIDPTKGPVFEARVRLNIPGATITADERWVVGLVNDHATAQTALDGTTFNVWFRGEGANLNILVEGDDNVTNTDDVDSTFDYADNVFMMLKIDMSDLTKVKFYVDGKSHLPLMLTWMDKEPLVLTMGGPGGGGNISIKGGQVQMSGGRGTSPEEAARMQQEMADRMKQAEANRRTVEYRMFYADYKTIDGVKLPTKIQRMMEGLPTDEMAFEKIKVNGKIDPNKFKVAK
jgi:hypothetical protein